jgi:hypothetical protein
MFTRAFEKLEHRVKNYGVVAENGIYKSMPLT